MFDGGGGLLGLPTFSILPCTFVGFGDLMRQYCFQREQILVKTAVVCMSGSLFGCMKPSTLSNGFFEPPSITPHPDILNLTVSASSLLVFLCVCVSLCPHVNARFCHFHPKHHMRWLVQHGWEMVTGAVIPLSCLLFLGHQRSSTPTPTPTEQPPPIDPRVSSSARSALAEKPRGMLCDGRGQLRIGGF